MEKLTVDKALDIAKDVALAEDVKNSEIADTLNGQSGEDIAVARLPISNSAIATRNMLSYTDLVLRDDVKEHGSFKMDGTVFHHTNPYSWKVVDMVTLMKWITSVDDKSTVIADLCALVGGSFVPSLRGMDSIATRRGMSKETARDTFLFKEFKDDGKLLIIHTEQGNTPVWANKMKEGKRYDTVT